jgi:hypothetical protein
VYCKDDLPALEPVAGSASSTPGPQRSMASRNAAATYGPQVAILRRDAGASRHCYCPLPAFIGGARSARWQRASRLRTPHSCGAKAADRYSPVSRPQSGRQQPRWPPCLRTGPPWCCAQSMLSSAMPRANDDEIGGRLKRIHVFLSKDIVCSKMRLHFHIYIAYRSEHLKEQFGFWFASFVRQLRIGVWGKKRNSFSFVIARHIILVLSFCVLGPVLRHAGFVSSWQGLAAAVSFSLPYRRDPVGDPPPPPRRSHPPPRFVSPPPAAFCRGSAQPQGPGAGRGCSSSKASIISGRGPICHR